MIDNLNCHLFVNPWRIDFWEKVGDVGQRAISLGDVDTADLFIEGLQLALVYLPHCRFLAFRVLELVGSGCFVALYTSTREYVISDWFAVGKLLELLPDAYDFVPDLSLSCYFSNLLQFRYTWLHLVFGVMF